MAANTKIKLFKIASEINIGREAIVEYLKNKGFDIENKPTSTLTPEMLEAVYDKFKKEKRAAEKQREKLEKIKGKREQAKEKEREEKELLTPQPEKTPVIVVEQTSEPIIDSTKETLTETETKSEDIKEEIEVPSDEVEKAEESKPKVEEIPQEPTIASDKVEESKEIESESIVQNQPAETQKDSGPRKKKKIKTVVEVDSDDSGNLPGLKIVGKIDIRSKRKEISRGKPKKLVKDDIKADEETGILSKPKKFKKRSKIQGEDVIEKVAPEKKKKKRKKTIREQINQADVDRAIRETLAHIDDHSSASRSKIRQKKKLEREEKELKEAEQREKESQILRLTEFVTTGDLANLMGAAVSEVIMKCMQLGLMVTINQRLEKDTITLIADDFGFEVEFHDQESAVDIEDEEDPVESLVPRSPIVTIMGHVDHGKTSLLDYIRHSNVVSGEAGGITQHIAAYKVSTGSGKSVTFLDTPGHEAFTAMRARGAQVTDIVVLVVSADDSVMPQTVEAISHAQAANVPIVVAINKMDKPDANPDRIKQQLTDHKILVEDWGGTHQSVEISAKTGQNVDQLLEKILLEAEMLELKANPDRKSRGTVIESHMSKGLGSVSTVIVQKGTLKVGDPFVAGASYGRVRAMFDERGNKVEEAGPSIPVGIIGFNELPEAGDVLIALSSDVEAKSVATERQQLKREQEFRKVRHITLDEISQQIQLGGVKDLNLIIKGDVGGSVEALSDSLLKLSREEVRVSIIHKGVGTINETDVMLAVASGAVVIGFQVSPATSARKLADKESVDIRLYNIIYDCINEIHLALEGLLSPELKESITSEVEIRKVFKISKTGNIAGCYVKSGKISRNDKVKLLREGLVVYNGSLHSLKREKEDVKEVDQGYECGIMLEGFNGIEEGDIIQGYKISEIKRTLD